MNALAPPRRRPGRTAGLRWLTATTRGRAELAVHLRRLGAARLRRPRRRQPRLPDRRPRRLVHELRQARRRDARGAAREGAVSGRRLPARHGRRPHRAARAGDVDGGPWRRGDDDHDARAERRRPGRRRRSSLRSARRPSPRSSQRGARSTLLQSLPQVDDDRIALVGWSSGARVGAIVAGVDERVKAFDLLSAGSPPVERVRLAGSGGAPARDRAGARRGRPPALGQAGAAEHDPAPERQERRGRAPSGARCARGSCRQGRRGALVRPGPCAVERGVGGSARLDGRPARRRRADREGRCAGP